MTLRPSIRTNLACLWQQASPDFEKGQRAMGLGSGALFDDGQSARAIEWSQRALELYPDDLSTLVSAACLSARTGQKEDALGFLERVFARGWGKRDWVEHDPDYDTLRDDPRFQKLLARLK